MFQIACFQKSGLYGIQKLLRERDTDTYTQREGGGGERERQPASQPDRQKEAERGCFEKERHP